MSFSDEKKQISETTTTLSPAESYVNGSHEEIADFLKKHERSYVKKLDFFLLPFLSLMYFFNSVDRSNLGNAKTDGFDVDMHFKGNDYSLLLLLFYIPNALLDMPLTILLKKFSGRWVLPTLMLIWGAVAMIQAACTNFGGMLVCRLIIGGTEAGFFAGVVFYLTLFYTRGEIAFRIALFFGSAVIAAAFSGLLAFGVFQIENGPLHGWQYLFIIEGGATVVLSIIAYFWLPESPQQSWWFTPEEKAAAKRRNLRDNSSSDNTELSWVEIKKSMQDWRWYAYAFISFTYTMAWTACANFLPQIVARLGYSTVKTNLYTVAPNCVGSVVLLIVTFSSDRFRERTFHITFALVLSLISLIILASIDVTTHKGVAYFATFLFTSGAYIPSCLVHSWHNNNNLSESSRAANTGIYVGLGNLAGIIPSATFRTEYAPKYIPMLVATATSTGLCIVSVLSLGLYMKFFNARRDREQGVKIRAGDLDTSEFPDGYNSPNWRFFT